MKEAGSLIRTKIEAVTIGMLYKLANGPRLEELTQLGAKQNAILLRG